MQMQASQRDRTLCLITAALFAASYVGAAAALKSLEMSSGVRIALALSPFPFFVAYFASLGVARRRYR